MDLKERFIYIFLYIQCLSEGEKSRAHDPQNIRKLLYINVKIFLSEPCKSIWHPVSSIINNTRKNNFRWISINLSLVW